MPSVTLLELPHLSVAANLVVAAVLGSLIGLERQLFQRYTGIATHALVALGAAAFVSISVLTPSASDITRIAGQVASGIGFLGAGLIFRDGLSVRGLSAAASVWATGAVGALAGFGYMMEAAEVAVLMFAANLALPRLARLVERFARHEAAAPSDYAITLCCRIEDEAAIRTELMRAIGESLLRLRGIESRHPADGATAEVVARVYALGNEDEGVEALVAGLGIGFAHTVTAARWTVTDAPD